jgi:hypothetical protein
MSAVVVSEILLGIAAAYAVIGLVTAFVFAAGGFRRLLGRETQVTAPARLLMMPAALALWPLLVCRRRVR